MWNIFECYPRNSHRISARNRISANHGINSKGFSEKDGAYYLTFYVPGGGVAPPYLTNTQLSLENGMVGDVIYDLSAYGCGHWILEFSTIEETLAPYFEEMAQNPIQSQEENTGDYGYQWVLSYEELEMPTQFDELSPRAATFAYPVSGDGWKTAPYSDSMTKGAILLQNYATSAGLVPLASEWWHFDDPNSGSGAILGDFMLTNCYAVPPYEAMS